MSTALVMTVRDEREMLRPNLLYHHFLGVDRCYVYDDGSTDGTAESVADLSFVAVRPSVGPADFADTSGARWSEQYASHVGARQRVNIEHAVATASSEGFQWLLAFDADEFVVVDRHSQARGSLGTKLNQLPADVEGAVFKPLEVLQRRLKYDDVLVEETLFKRTDSRATHVTFDPFSDAKRKVSVAYGHAAGKMAVRLSSRPRPKSTHRFVHSDGSALRTRPLGDLLHFYSHDADAFIHKFRLIHDHPDKHVQGSDVAFQKRLWRDVVNKSGMDDGQLREYFRKWVMFTGDDVRELRRSGRLPFLASTPVVVEVTALRDALNEMRREGAA